MKGYQSFVVAFTAAVFVFTGSVFGSIPDVTRNVHRIPNEEDNNISSGVPIQSEPPNIKTNDVIASVFVSFSENRINGNTDNYIKSIFSTMDKSCTTILIGGDSLKLDDTEMITKQLVPFLEAVLDENQIRQDEGLDTLQIFFYIQVQTVHKIDIFRKLGEVGAGLGSYIFGRGIISGIVLESSLIQGSLEVEVDGSTIVLTEMEVLTGIVRIKLMMKSLELIFGYGFKLGLSVNSFSECGAVYLNVHNVLISQFDLILFDGISHSTLIRDYSRYGGNPLGDLYSKYCHGFFLEKLYYRVKMVL